jgi:hypothetical protein
MGTFQTPSATFQQVLASIVVQHMGQLLSYFFILSANSIQMIYYCGCWAQYELCTNTDRAI